MPPGCWPVSYIRSKAKDKPRARTLRCISPDDVARRRTRQVVDMALDDDPERVLGRMLGHVCARPPLVLAGLSRHRERCGWSRARDVSKTRAAFERAGELGDRRIGRTERERGASTVCRIARPGLDRLGCKARGQSQASRLSCSRAGRQNWLLRGAKERSGRHRQIVS